MIKQSIHTGAEKNAFIRLIQQMQDDLCLAIEQLDGKAVFKEDAWQRPEGGGGKTRVISNGRVFEKGGINTSIVHGNVTEAMKRQLHIAGDKWFAAGISSVIHPINPFVPTVHFNYRMFELYDGNDQLMDRWFGGGTDLTPYYVDDHGIKQFHKVLYEACEAVMPGKYKIWKKQCDDYFVNHHRHGERRGVGGIFYDHLREDKNIPATKCIALAEACGYAFLQAYIPIVEAHQHDNFTAQNKFWQEIRRGRYVEFNLVHDRGTLFGLKTNGRTESILMSLPPTVRFEYGYQPEKGSPEEKLQHICLHPKDWV